MSFLVAGAGHADQTLTIGEAQAQIAALQSKEDGAVEAYDEGQIAVTATKTQAAAAAAAVVTQGTRLQTMYAGIRSFAIASYMTGGVDPLSQMLAQGDPETFLQRAGALDQISHNQQLQVAAVHKQAVVFAAAQKTAQKRADAASASLHELASSRDRIEGLISQQQAVLSHLQAVQRAELLAQQKAAQAAAAAAARAALLAQQKAAAAQAVAAHAAAVQAAATRAAAAQAAAARAAATQRTAAHRAASHATPPTAPPPTPPSQPTPPPVQPPSGGGSSSNAGLIALAAAETQMGKPYQWGGSGPDSYDCSGLVMWAFAHAGISLPHSAADQYGYGTHVSVSDLEPGDLVFYDDGSFIGHVGIYVGNGDMIDANHTGGWIGIRPLYSGLVGATRI